MLQSEIQCSGTPNRLVELICSRVTRALVFILVDRAALSRSDKPCSLPRHPRTSQESAVQIQIRLVESTVLIPILNFRRSFEKAIFDETGWAYPVEIFTVPT